MSKPDNDEPFLSRWSRRKRAVESSVPAEQEVAVDALATAATAELEASAAAPAAPEEELDLSTLPKVEELDATSDITAFLDKRVPALLRNAALSRMWTLDPTIRDFIEVAENQWNWNVPGGAPFYEEMLPGSGASTMFADATSAIARTVESAAVGQQVATADVAISDIHNQQSVDADAHAAAAPQQAPHAEVTSTRLSLTDKAVDQERPVSRSEPIVAMQQQEAVGVSSPRRRHGGALPG